MLELKGTNFQSVANRFIQQVKLEPDYGRFQDFCPKITISTFSVLNFSLIKNFWGQHSRKQQNSRITKKYLCNSKFCIKLIIKYFDMNRNRGKTILYFLDQNTHKSTIVYLTYINTYIHEWSTRN